MRREILHPGAGKLRYEIREIAAFARSLEKWNIPIQWENIGDPVKKGEPVAAWIKEIVREKAGEDLSYAYSETEGAGCTREFLAERVNGRPSLKKAGKMPLENPDMTAKITANDILFFNGLGDAITKVFGFLAREARVLGPSPAYSSLSSAEAAHSGYEHVTYRLNPKKDWMPDMADVELKVKYNDSIAGILLINPDNPTGTVYPVEILSEFVRIAKNYGLFIVCDETYANIVYGGAETAALSQVIGEVPGLALRSISKEIPWPGARCGWAEIFNRGADKRFDAYICSLLEAKRLEVCSTSLPQLCIPAIMGDPRYSEHLAARAAMYEKRAQEAEDILGNIPGTLMKKPRGAFYASMVFENEYAKNEGHCLPVKSNELREFITGKTRNLKPDKQFAYWLLASAGICVVPLSGFTNDPDGNSLLDNSLLDNSLSGFRFTLLEHNDEKRRWIFSALADAVCTYNRRPFIG